MTTAIFLVTLALLIWFKSDAFTEYAKLLKLDGWLKVKDWEEFKNTMDASTTYLVYLRMKYPTFLIKLITCPICLSVWLSMPSIFFNIWAFPIVCVSSLGIYYGITKLMN